MQFRIGPAASRALLQTYTRSPAGARSFHRLAVIAASPNGDHGGSHRQQHSGSSSSGRSYQPPYTYALIPFFASSPLLCDNAEATGLAEVKRHLDHPEAKDFLIADGASAEEEPPNFFWRTLHFLNEWLLEPLYTARRFIHLAVLFLPVIATAPILLLESFESAQAKRRGRDRREGERTTTRWWYRFLVAQMERAGPTFIKLAQWAGSRTDLFPSSLCILFGKLHSNGKPHTLKHTKRVIERAFGKPFDEIFIEFPDEPMGIGAIAQVYKAVLNPDLLPPDYLGPKHIDDPSPISTIGRTLIPSPDDRKPQKVPSAAVAIKVLHPGVEKMITRDLKIMFFFASILNFLPGMEWLSFPEEVQVFGQMMMSQVDLRIEANNLSTFEKKFMHRPTVSFPRALKPYTSRQVLTEEYEDAVPLEAFLNDGAGPFDTRIANLGLDAFLNMLLVDNYCHADLHPGNIMIKFFKPTTKSMLTSLWANWRDLPERDSASDESNIHGVEIVHKLRSLSKDPIAWKAELERLDAEGYQPEIVFIDAGLVTHLDDTNRKNFLDLFSAIAQFDGYRAGKLMVERCRAPDLVIGEEEFALRIQHLTLSVKSQTFSLAKIRIADVLSEVLYNVRQHHVKFEADFVNTVISILLLEGIGRQLDPEMDLFKSALPVLRSLGTQMRPHNLTETGLDFKSLGSMFKIWVWIEAKNMAQQSSSEIEDLLRYDRFAPNV